MKRAERRFTAPLTVLWPEKVLAPLDSAAERSCMTVSEYVRRSVIDRLQADGFDLTAITA